LFSKFPYTAVVECAEQKDSLYIALPDGKNYIKPENIKRILEALQNLINEPDNLSFQVTLFQEIYISNNKRLLGIVDSEIDFIKGKIKKIRDNIKETEQYLRKRKEVTYNEARVKELKERLNLNQKVLTYFYDLNRGSSTDLLKQSFFEDFTRLNFSKFLSLEELNNIREELNINSLLKEGKIKVVHEKYGKGIHVELQGLMYARQQNPKESKFNIGLANAAPKKPFCCAGCTAEREGLKKYDIIMEVSAISHNNFPPRAYQPSPNVTEDPKKFIEYLKELLSYAQEKSTDQRRASTRESNEAIRDIERAIREMEKIISKLEESKRNLEVKKRLKPTKAETEAETKETKKRHRETVRTEDEKKQETKVSKRQRREGEEEQKTEHRERSTDGNEQSHEARARRPSSSFERRLQRERINDRDSGQSQREQEREENREHSRSRNHREREQRRREERKDRDKSHGRKDGRE
jgi:hypothetical protein